MSPARIVPICAICGLALAILIYSASAKSNVTFDGVFVRNFSLYEFYPVFRGCEIRGNPYWMVPNEDFEYRVDRTIDLEHVERVFRTTWHVRFRGDFSRIGRYGFLGKYWRQVRVLNLVSAEPVNCWNSGKLEQTR
jgi:hypothetical protein